METLTFRDLPLFCSFTAPDVIIRPVRGRPSRRIKGFREVAGCSTGIMVIKPRGDRHHVAKMLPGISDTENGGCRLISLNFFSLHSHIK